MKGWNNMEQVTKTNLPIVGRIQHGMQQIVNQKKKSNRIRIFYCNN